MRNCAHVCTRDATAAGKNECAQTERIKWRRCSLMHVRVIRVSAFVLGYKSKRLFHESALFRRERVGSEMTEISDIRNIFGGSNSRTIFIGAHDRRRRCRRRRGIRDVALFIYFFPIIRWVNLSALSLLLSQTAAFGFFALLFGTE